MPGGRVLRFLQATSADQFNLRLSGLIVGDLR
jgi:hypothetical protein